MNPTNTQDEWTQIKRKIGAKWSKFADADIESFRGNMDIISDKIQKAYGYSKEKAEQEYKDFKKTIDSASSASVSSNSTSSNQKS